MNRAMRRSGEKSCRHPKPETRAAQAKPVVTGAAGKGSALAGSAPEDRASVKRKGTTQGSESWPAVGLANGGVRRFGPTRRDQQPQIKDRGRRSRLASDGDASPEARRPNSGSARAPNTAAARRGNENRRPPQAIATETPRARCVRRVTLETTHLAGSTEAATTPTVSRADEPTMEAKHATTEASGRSTGLSDGSARERQRRRRAGRKGRPDAVLGYHARIKSSIRWPAGTSTSTTSLEGGAPRAAAAGLGDHGPHSHQSPTGVGGTSHRQASIQRTPARGAPSPPGGCGAGAAARWPDRSQL